MGTVSEIGGEPTASCVLISFVLSESSWSVSLFDDFIHYSAWLSQKSIEFNVSWPGTGDNSRDLSMSAQIWV